MCEKEAMKPSFETDGSIEDRFGVCPYATAQSLISGKWAVLILHYLADGPFGSMNFSV